MTAHAEIAAPYKHTSLFPLGHDRTPYRKLTGEGVRLERAGRHELLVVEREALRMVAEAAFTDINHLLRPGHLQQLRAILEDPQASDNDTFVAYDFLKNANIAAGGILPMCQDTGTVIIMGKKGRLVFTEGLDEAALAEGARDAYFKRNLRYSQLAPVSMFEETNTKSNMPAQVEIYAEGAGEHEDEYKFLFIAKGGGSAANISATTCVWCGCRATAQACRSGSACRARPTGRRSARSRATACSSRSSSTIRRNICPRWTQPSSAAMWCRSTCAGR